MKLVEILARNLKKWEHRQSPATGKYMVLSQRSNGDIFNANSMAHYIEQEAQALRNFELADDWEFAEVTHAQWEAERARISVDEAPKWHIGTETEEWREECQKQYEQELWDKVALKTLAAQIQNPQSIAADVGWCADVADAFMAERAKRMKK